MLGHIAAGVICGPTILDLIPFTDCLRLIGKLGVLLYVVEGGLALTYENVRKNAVRGAAAALVGVILPLGLTVAFLSLYEPEEQVSVKGRFAAGAAVAPTSLGFTAILLEQYGDADTDIGNVICIAAVIDDILSLLLLSEIEALGGEGDVDVWDICVPILACFSAILVGAIICQIIPGIVTKAQNSRTLNRYYRWGIVPPILALALLMAYGIASTGSSDLMGAFIAGVAFSGVDGAREAWDAQCKRITQWGARFFFACTIAFSIPDSLFEASALATAAGLFCAGFLGKIVSGLFAQPLTRRNALKFGLAMNGRGEFGFLIAERSFAEGLYGRVVYGGIVLSLLACSIVSSVGFRFCASSRKRNGDGDSEGTKELEMT